MSGTDLLRLFHTVRHLRLRQLFGRLVFRLYRPVIDTRPVPQYRPCTGPWVGVVAKPPAIVDDQKLRFLNCEYPLVTPRDWNDPARPKLWLYNLHYFDFLQAEDRDRHRDRHLELICRWMTENSPAVGNGWEPYPLSLRLVNWIKWALAGNDLPSDAVQSLAVQARYLRRRLENHLLGNHLFANAKALVFAGLFFAGAQADEWFRKGQGILVEEIAEQILGDGGHFERSPMYHAIILEDLLDLVNLFHAYGREVPESWREVCGRMGDWLEAMTHPDGDPVLFNDAACGIAPTLAELDAYATSLGWERRQRPLGPLTALAQSGYVRCASRDAVLFLDVAAVGPDYLPGHAHADTLTFELSLFGRRVIVDSGTSTYEKNAERQRQRGTRAHNTVCIDNADSSEVWGGFRVARRARPFGLGMEERGGQIHVACGHDGYRRLPGRPMHRREWRLNDKELEVRDRVEGGFSRAVACYHFHPDVDLVLTAPDEGQGRLAGGRTLSFKVSGGQMRLVDGSYHPQFNVGIPNKCLEVSFAGKDVTVHFSWE